MKYSIADIDGHQNHFDSLQALVKEYSHALTTPYRPDFIKQPYISFFLPTLLLFYVIIILFRYFRVDLTPESAERELQGRPAGTFLAYFLIVPPSSPSLSFLSVPPPPSLNRFTHLSFSSLFV